MVLRMHGATTSLVELGNNSAAARSSPVTVVGGIINWTQVSAGGMILVLV
jgi:hypothetical protein